MTAPLPNIDFVNKEHPRTCLCKTHDPVIFTTIDGRFDLAIGTLLDELQTLLKSWRCINAMNLDGGGSTTMWIRKRVS